MKKMTIYGLFFLAMGNWDMGLAQSSTAANTAGATRFLGWASGGTAQTLEIRNDYTQPIIFSTNSVERFRITEDDHINAFKNTNGLTPSYGYKFEINDANPSGSNSTPTDLSVLLRVRGLGFKLPGSPASSIATENFTLSEIIQKRNNAGDAGFRIQGSRNTCETCDIGFIDFANWSSGSSLLFNMSRIASGQHTNSGTHLGNLIFYTNDGSGDPTQATDNGLLERMRINGYGVGYFNMAPSGVNSNLQSYTARFNIFDNDRPQLRLVHEVNASNVALVYTSLETTGDGDLYIAPVSENFSDEQRYVGIHTNDPKNTLEINATPASEEWDVEATNGTSGLRFSHLDDSKTPLTNTGAGVLSVDDDGDVVYVNIGSGYGICGDANGILSADSKIELNENNFYFDVDASSTNDTDNKVGVGYECNDALPARFSVYQNISGNISPTTKAGSFINGDQATSGTGDFIGIYGSSIGASNNPLAPIRNIGVYGYAANNTGANIGVYGEAATSGSNRAGYFVGDLQTTAAAVITSDKMFKQNVSKEKSALELLSKLSPVTYNMKIKEFPQFNLSDKKQHGFIAQELETVLPELVHESYHPETLDENGKVIHEAVEYKSVNYNGLISINTQAINELNQKVEEKDAIIKEQEKKIEDLNNRLSQLENCLSALLPALCQMNQSAIEQNTPESQQALKQQLQTILSDRNTIVLTQNVPNPFAEATVIEYNIPATVAQAQIHFYDAQGKLIQSVDITTRGNGELKVFANDLSKGTYSYNLVADGKIVASKKMMKL